MTVLVPFGLKSFDVNGIIKLNETAKFLWDHSTGDFTAETLINDLMKEYKIDRETAAESGEIDMDKMKEGGSKE